MRTLLYFAKCILGAYKYLINQRYGEVKYDIEAAELLRNTHSIEKGLSIANPRLGFGHEKQQQMMNQIILLEKSSSLIHNDICKMALGALEEYINFHTNVGYKDDFIKLLSKFLIEHHDSQHTQKWGGTQILNRQELSFNIAEIEHFFMTRHSIRDFSEEPVNEDILRKALELAQQSPSACNRQAVRIYVLGDEQRKVLLKQLNGIGGFAESVSRYVLITAKTSFYRLNEENQYIVSASMYAAYCSLTLHLYGMGACIIQREVNWNKNWENLKRLCKIAKDEQAICLLAIGNLKKNCRVPVSHRIKNDEMIRFM